MTSFGLDVPKRSRLLTGPCRLAMREPFALFSIERLICRIRVSVYDHCNTKVRSHSDSMSQQQQLI